MEKTYFFPYDISIIFRLMYNQTYVGIVWEVNMNFEEYYSLGEQIHSCLLDVRGMKDEMKQLDKMLDNIQDKLNSTVDSAKLANRNIWFEYV